MTDNPIVFIDDGEQFLNVAMIEAVIDVRRGSSQHEPRRIAIVAGREYTSPGNAGELIAAMEGLMNLNDPLEDIPKRIEWPSPGRPMDD